MKFLPNCPTDHKLIGSGDGMPPTRSQTITWLCNEPILWHIYASRGLNVIIYDLKCLSSTLYTGCQRIGTLIVFMHTDGAIIVKN